MSSIDDIRRRHLRPVRDTACRLGETDTDRNDDSDAREQGGIAAFRTAEVAWEYLRSHPKLRWLPPAWRDRSGKSVEDFEIKAVERNLVIRLEGRGSRSLFVVTTGPLEDFIRDGEPDPLTPRMTTDERLRGEGRTFEEAVRCLADAVQMTYGP